MRIANSLPRGLLWALVALTILVVVSGCGGGSSSVLPGGGGGGGGGGGSALEQATFDLVNDARAQNGAAALAWSDDVAAVARAHSQDMADRGYFSHINPEGQNPGDRLTAGGVAFLAWAENLAKISNRPDVAQAAVDGWMNSPGHRTNMLNALYDKSGMGVVLGGDGYVYFTQVFIKAP